MVSKEGADITEAEAAVYDRQIRLWGMESQKRLRNSNILIAGLGGLGAEVAKNLILAGIKSVTFLDHEVTSVEDKGAQFLVSQDAVGDNRAKVSVTRAKILNPLVSITADTANINTKTEEFFAKFDVVVITGCDIDQLIHINEMCRRRNVKLFCGDVYGMFGYYFVDCLRHEHVAEMSYRDLKGERVYAKTITTYVPLSETFSFDWSQMSPRKLKRIGPAYFIFRVIQEFKKKLNRNPDRQQRASDLEILKQISQTVLEELSVPADSIPDSIFGMLFGQVSPSCAVVGGLLAQDVIRAVSLRDTPTMNMFFFNPERCRGTVHNLGNVKSVNLSKE